MLHARINKQTFYSNCAGSIALRGAAFGEGTGMILLGSLLCNGSESDLVQCPRKDNIALYAATATCEHSEDAGVICESEWVVCMWG